MTTKELVIVPPDRFVHFGDMDIGDVCRNGEGKYFIKIESVSGGSTATAHLVFNAVNLVTGLVDQFMDDDEVIPVQSVKFSIIL